MRSENPSWQLSRSILSQSSNLWDFHASWCRFVDKKHDGLSARNHRHAVYELHCLLSGSAEVIFEDGTQLTLHGGEFILIPPRVFHRFVYGASDAEKLVTGFSVQPYTDAVAEALQSAGEVRVYSQSVPLQELIGILDLKAGQYYTISSRASVFLLQSVILECLEIVRPTRIDAPQTENIKNSSSDIRLDNAIRYIREHITQEITCEEIARHLGISQRQLNRLSTRLLARSIGRLILEMRIQYAQNLLEISPLSLSDIAAKLHYSSVYAFIRSFKSVTGTTPGKYQKDVSSR